MKNLRNLFFVLAFGFGLCGQRAQAQIAGQNVTFSIICQYVTNVVIITNTTTGVKTYYNSLQTVILNTANVAKAIAVQKFYTNWAEWSPADIFYEVNLQTGNQGIFLHKESVQTNVSDLFGNSFSNMFSQNVDSVFSGTNYAASLPLGGNLNDDSSATLVTNINHFANLAYVSFIATNTNTALNNTNMVFNLFGYSQGTISHAGGYLDGVLYQRYLPVAEIVGAGTFSLNLTTNVFSIVTTNGTPTNYTGVAHGTIYVGAPFFLSYVTNGP